MDTCGTRRLSWILTLLEWLKTVFHPQASGRELSAVVKHQHSFLGVLFTVEFLKLTSNESDTCIESAVLVRNTMAFCQVEDKVFSHS